MVEIKKSGLEQSWRLVYDKDSKNVMMFDESIGETATIYELLEFSNKEDGLNFIKDNNLIYTEFEIRADLNDF